MAYSHHTISAITEIPALVAAFAATNGFDVDTGDPNAPVINAPGDSNSAEENLPFELSASISGTNNQNHDLIWEVAGSHPEVTSLALTRSPKLSGSTNNPTVSTPTGVHIFGTAIETDNPFIAIVIEYGFNSYRHLYFGKMEAIGGYEGREVIAGNAGPDASGTANLEFNNDAQSKYLFSARSTLFAAASDGGVNVDHVNNPEQWRRFNGPTGATPHDEWAEDAVMGGFMDAINDGYLGRGKSSFGGVNILVPINLYATDAITGDTTFIPIGRPPGVRMVHMQDLEPGAQITVGNETWRVFPAMSKNSSTTAPVGGGNYRQYETSYYVGYAYLEEDAP